MPLSLDPNAGQKPGSGQKPEEKKPVLGWVAVGFGLLSIFGPAVIFVPLGLLVSIAALFMGQAVWGIVGIILATAGLLTSPILLGAIGIGAFALTFDWQDLIQPFLDMIGGDETTEV